MVQNRTKKKIGDKNEDHMNFSPWLVHETERFWCSICGEILVFYLWRDSGVLICREILVFCLWRDSGVLSVEIFWCWCSICGEILVFYLWRDSGDIKHFGDVKLKCRKKCMKKVLVTPRTCTINIKSKQLSIIIFVVVGHGLFTCSKPSRSYFWFEYERASYINTTYLQTFLLVECKIHSSPKSTPIFRPLFSWLSG